jgi:hypothetical protein
MTASRIPRQMINYKFKGKGSQGATQKKMAKPNLRSCNRPWSLMLDVQEENKKFLLAFLLVTYFA